MAKEQEIVTQLLKAKQVVTLEVNSFRDTVVEFIDQISTKLKYYKTSEDFINL